MGIPLHDTFTGAAGNLSAHAPEVGGTWVIHPIYSGGLVLDGTGNLLLSATNVDTLWYNTVAPASPDYDVTVKIGGSILNSEFPAAAGRIDPTTDTYYRAQANTTAHTLHLYKTVAGVTTELVVAGFANFFAGDTITLSMVGTTIVALHNGVALVTATDNAITAAGKAGLKHYGSVIGTSFDEITVTDTSSSATTYAMTGPTAGPVFAASAVFTFTPNATWTGTVTPVDAGGGTFTPATLTWAASAVPKTCTLNRNAISTANVTATNSGTLINPGAISYTTKPTTTKTYTVDGTLAGHTLTYAVKNNDGTYFKNTTATGVVDQGGGTFSVSATVPLDLAGLILWTDTTTSASASEPLDHGMPVQADVRAGVVYDNGAKVGTLDPEVVKDIEVDINQISGGS